MQLLIYWQVNLNCYNQTKFCVFQYFTFIFYMWFHLLIQSNVYIFVDRWWRWIYQEAWLWQQWTCKSSLNIWKHRWWEIIYPESHVLWWKRSFQDLFTSVFMYRRSLGSIWPQRKGHRYRHRGPLRNYLQSEPEDAFTAEDSRNIWYHHLPNKSRETTQWYVPVSMRVIFSLYKAFFRRVRSHC